MAGLRDPYGYQEGAMEKQRILLVEDNARFREDFARVLERALAAEPLEVVLVEAGSLAEARERLRAGGLAAALIDARLPDGDGLDLVREINDGGALGASRRWS
jgi:CheY-like chemotaxis protein